jgi:hypothetical protein
MTYGRLKDLVSGLLTGDFQLNVSDGEMLGLLEYAYIMLADNADVLRLFSLSKDNVHRIGISDFNIRQPKLPDREDEELDIDNELCPAVARYIASFLSKTKAQWHEQKALEIINNYNAKVLAYIEREKQEQVERSLSN